MSRDRAISRSLAIAALTLLSIGGGGAAAAQKQPPRSKPLQQALDAHARGEERKMRIVLGAPTTIEKHAWQVALVATAIPENPEAQFCGGSIVARRWVLTAAHCVDRGTEPSDVAVLTGTSSLTSGGTRIPLVAGGIVVHERWSPETSDNDIALLHLAADAGGTAIRGRVPGETGLVPGDLITVTGWGAVAYGLDRGSLILQQADVPYVSRDTCNESASYGGAVTERMFCAGESRGGADACQGDSGGPATIRFANTSRLVGIVSWGEGCGLPNKYGVYTRVSQFVEWIRTASGGEVSW